MWTLIRSLTEWRIWVPRTMTEAWNIGVGSLFIVLLISGFAGAVTALQARYQFTGTIPIYYLAGVIVESIVLELGPVLTGLVLAGRIGARYAAELGTMRVTEQIDALESLGRSPASHLILPRVLAGFIMIPVLVDPGRRDGHRRRLVLDDAGAARSPTRTSPTAPASFWRPFDATYSVIKAFFFAGSITIISCYMGFNTQQGAEGVGRATTGAVVSSSVLILLLDVLLAKLLLSHMIELRDVHKRFGKQVVLDGVDFDVQEGETVALLGPSGTGKSVLLKHIIGLIRPDSGTVIVDDKDVGRLKRKELAELRSRIGYVFQNGALFDSMNVFENVRLGITDEEKYRDEEYCPGSGSRSASSW